MEVEEFRIKDAAEAYIYQYRNTRKFSPHCREDVLEVAIETTTQDDKPIALYKVLFDKGHDIMDNPIWKFRQVVKVKQYMVGLP